MGKSFRETWNVRMQDENFRAEWKNLEPQRQIIRAIIDGQEKQHLTQKELAELTGIAQADISRLH